MRVRAYGRVAYEGGRIRAALPPQSATASGASARTVGAAAPGIDVSVLWIVRVHALSPVAVAISREYISTRFRIILRCTQASYPRC